MKPLTLEQRVEKMMADNPGRTAEECATAVSAIRAEKRDRLLSEVPAMYREASLADLGHSEGIVRSALDLAFSADAKSKACGIVFTGNPGSGKTHALYAIVRHLAEADPESVSYVASYGDMMQRLRREFAQDTYGDFGSDWLKLNSAGLILIDDVSAGKPTDFELDKFLSFMGRRMDEFYPFVLTTNVNPKDFDRVFGERLASRLWGYSKIVEFDDRDRRI